MRIKIKHIFLVISSILFIACGGNVSQKPVVTVSLQPQKYFLEKIVGDKIDVKCLLASGGNPETYEPSLTHLVNLENSEAYFMIGNLGFETAIIERVKNNNPDLKIYNNSEGVDLLVGTHGECCHHNHLSGEHSHDIDPHTWSSVKNARIMAKNMCDAMIEVDKKNAVYYTKNYKHFVSELDSLDARLTSMLAPKKGTAFLVWHPSLSYFARDYGLLQISVGQEGKEASVQQLQSKIDEAKAHNAGVFFYQKEFDSRQAEVVNEQIGAEMVVINPLNYQWNHEMLIIADAIASK